MSELELTPRTRALLDNVVLVLCEPKDVVNIAAVIRAMKNMGLSRLRLVNPVEVDAWRIEGIAHRTGDIVEAAEIFSSLEEAVADTVFVVGTTARARTEGRNYTRPHEVAPGLVERAGSGRVALVFGREDRGLTNRQLDVCHRVAIVPTDPGYGSLNLAQAALILMYEVLMAAGGGDQELPVGRRATRPATRKDLEDMYEALEGGLARMEFFKARKPQAVLRTLRTILGRAELDLRESRLVRAIGFEIRHYLDRMCPAPEDQDGPGDEKPGENP